jgi:hypothetical protein
MIGTPHRRDLEGSVVVAARDDCRFNTVGARWTDGTSTPSGSGLTEIAGLQGFTTRRDPTCGRRRPFEPTSVDQVSEGVAPRGEFFHRGAQARNLDGPIGR